MIKGKYILGLLFLVLVSLQLKGQNYCSFTLEKDSVFIGDPVYVQFKVVKTKRLGVIDLSALNNIEALNDTTQTDVSIDSYGTWTVNDRFIVDQQSLEWKKNEEGKEEASTRLKLVFWDNGVYRLPQIRIQNGMPIQTPIIRVYAPQDLVKTAGDSTTVIKPIKSILKENKNFSDYLPFILVVLGLVLFIWLIIHFTKKKSKKIEIIEPPKPKIPAHTLALSSLEKLSKKELWQKGKIKEYQSELTHIIRAYLGDRYGINALENTTEEILEDLKKTDFDDDLRSQVSNILQMADMIKFAKAKPSKDIHQTFWDQAKSLVLKTKIEKLNETKE